MMKEETTYHIPVLLMPSVDAMNIRPDGTYVDVTFGGGGHSREILSRLDDGGRLLLHSYAATSATCTTSYAITASKKWMPYLPTSAYLPITLMTANGDSPSASTGHWICV